MTVGAHHVAFRYLCEQSFDTGSHHSGDVVAGVFLRAPCMVEVHANGGELAPTVGTRNILSRANEFSIAFSGFVPLDSALIGGGHVNSIHICDCRTHRNGPIDDEMVLVGDCELPGTSPPATT